MDIDEFERTTQPKAKRSKLEPFQAEIFELKRKGYANWQIRDWLSTNDIEVTQEAVRKFIKNREKSIEKKHIAPPVLAAEKTSTNTTNATKEPDEKPKRNPFREKKKPDGDIRRNQFEYDPKPDLKKIYGDIDNE